MATDRLFGDVWVGSETGLLKAVDLQKGSFKNVDGLQLQSDQEKLNEICAMCWTNTDNRQLLLGLRKGTVKTYDIDKDDVIGEQDCTEGDGLIRGLGCDGTSLVTCVESGLIRIWDQENGNMKTEFKVGSHISKMQHNATNFNQVGTGGRENDLKIWDLNRPGQATFIAKNVRNDSLELRVPVWITDFGFFPSVGSLPKVVTGTGYHQLRLYDTAAQKRPVLSMEIADCPISAISVPNNDHLVIVGNTQGTMASVDIRKGQIVGHFKGFAGSIRCIECCDRQNLVAACGLDRFLRVYDLKTRTVQQKVYLKSRLNRLLFTNQQRNEKDAGSVEGDTAGHASSDSKVPSHDDDGGGDDDDELWNNMEVVASENKRRKTTKTKKKRSKKLKS